MEIKDAEKICQAFKEHDRFKYPPNMVRVTAGHGGETILIFGSEKTVLYDCGMAYCHENTVKNIEAALKNRGRDQLNMVLISHTHYDHVGALPYILDRWPAACVCGAEKAKTVFQSSGAAKTMIRLGEAARDSFSHSSQPIRADGMRIDRIVKEGHKIYIGEEDYFYVLETKGHTDCSLTYVLEPMGIMFTSESTGVLRNPTLMHTAILKSYENTIESAQKCKNYGPRQLVATHYGILPEGFVDEYFDMYVKFAENERDFILDLWDKGFDRDQIMKEFENKLWSERRSGEQPKAAFLENSKYVIKHIIETFREVKFTN